MTAFVHTLSDGMELTVEIKRRAKKNLIIRPTNTHTVRISVPPCFSVSALNRWLYENEAVLRQTLAKTPPPQTAENRLPEHIRFHGRQLALTAHQDTQILLMPSEIRVPEGAPENSLRCCGTFGTAGAQLPDSRLERHARTTQLFPPLLADLCQNLPGRVPQNHRHTLQLAASRRTGIRCRLCLHTRTLPPRPRRPQPRVTGTDPPLRTLHARSETVAQNPRQGTFLPLGSEAAAVRVRAAAAAAFRRHPCRNRHAPARFKPR